MSGATPVCVWGRPMLSNEQALLNEAGLQPISRVGKSSIKVFETKDT